MMVKMQHSVQRGFQGYCLSLSGGFSASRLVRWLLGFSACPAASRLRGFSASRLARRLLGFAASRLLGFSACPVASRLLGFLASRLVPGFSASRLVSYFAASRLVSGFSASRLLVAFLGPFCPCFAFIDAHRYSSGISKPAMFDDTRRYPLSYDHTQSWSISKKHHCFLRFPNYTANCIQKNISK